MARNSGQSRVWPTSRNLWHTSGERPWRGSFGKFWGQEGSREHIFFTWLNEPVGLKGQGLHLGKFPRTSPEGLENGRRELAGQAQGGAGTRGPWRVGRGRTEPQAQAGAQPVSPPSWRGSELWLRGCFASALGWPEELPPDQPTAALHKGAGGFLSPCEPLRGRDPSRCVSQPTRHLLPYSFSHPPEISYSSSSWSPTGPRQDFCTLWSP